MKSLRIDTSEKSSRVNSFDLVPPQYYLICRHTILILICAFWLWMLRMKKDEILSWCASFCYIDSTTPSLPLGIECITISFMLPERSCLDSMNEWKWKLAKIKFRCLRFLHDCYLSCSFLCQFITKSLLIDIVETKIIYFSCIRDSWLSNHYLFFNLKVVMNIFQLFFKCKIKLASARKLSKRNKLTAVNYFDNSPFFYCKIYFVVEKKRFE